VFPSPIGVKLTHDYLYNCPRCRKGGGGGGRSALVNHNHGRNKSEARQLNFKRGGQKPEVSGKICSVTFGSGAAHTHIAVFNIIDIYTLLRKDRERNPPCCRSKGFKNLRERRCRKRRSPTADKGETHRNTKRAADPSSSPQSAFGRELFAGSCGSCGVIDPSTPLRMTRLDASYPRGRLPS
jgi:hypothetical protein